MRTFLLSLIFLSMPFCIIAQNSAEKEVLAKSSLLYQYHKNQNWDAFENMIAENATFQHGRGMIQDSNTYLAMMRAGITLFKDINIIDQNIKFFGNTAVITGDVDLTVEVVGREQSNGVYKYQEIEVYSNINGEWKLVLLTFRFRE